MTLLIFMWAQPVIAETSSLWGISGEAFDDRGRLMDWSYAGYGYGEMPIPSAEATVVVTDYGAVPDDAGDDTAAIQQAIAAAAAGGVVSIPAGTFVVSDKLILTDGVVLRGAGRDTTILDIPVSLTDVYGNPGLESGGTSSYSFNKGFIEARGGFSNDVLASVTANAARGDRSIALSETDGIQAGQWIRIQQVDVGGEFIDRLHADLMSGGTDNVGDKWEFHSRVSAVTANGIEIERALPVDLDTRWSPSVFAFDPQAAEIGVEALSLRFPATSYPGHFRERGYNAIYFLRVANSWVRDVRISNADYGVNLSNCFFVTVAEVVLDTTSERGSIVGHHGLNNGHGGDNLFVDFDIRATFQHDLTNEWYATGVVFARGRGDNLRMDHHRAAPYATLWTEIDAGAGTTPFVSGGRGDRGPHTAAYDTLWNVRASNLMDLPADNYGPRMNFIGFQTSATAVTSPYDWWLETISPDELQPANLWEAMRERRLGPASTVFSPVPYYGDAEHYVPKTPNRWRVVEEAGDLRYMLRTSSYTRDGDKLGEYALVVDRSFDDFTLTLRAKTAEVIATNMAADYAVVFGYQDADNHYYLLANATASYSELFVVHEGLRSAIASSTTALIPDTAWHTIEVSRVGDRISVLLDGEPAMSVLDATWMGGAVGVGSFNDAVYFDDIEVDDHRPMPPELDAGPVETPDMAADLEAVDSGVQTADGGVHSGRDVGPDRSAADSGGTSPGKSSGCGCRMTTESPAGWWLLFLVAVACRRRRCPPPFARRA